VAVWRQSRKKNPGISLNEVSLLFKYNKISKTAADIIEDEFNTTLKQKEMGKILSKSIDMLAAEPKKK